MVKQTVKELKYSLYVTVRPFKGFWEIKHEGEGSFRTAMLILAALVLATALSPFFTEWLFVPYRSLRGYNVFLALLTYASLFFAWCVSNWCFTCLSDGEGTLKDICTVSAYAMVPLLIVTVTRIVLSHFFVIGEKPLYDLIGSAGVIWTAMLLVFGILVAHQYTLLKTLAVCFATLCGMVIMAYIGLLFTNLVAEILVFFTVLFDEIRQFRY